MFKTYYVDSLRDVFIDHRDKSMPNMRYIRIILK